MKILNYEIIIKNDKKEKFSSYSAEIEKEVSSDTNAGYATLFGIGYGETEKEAISDLKNVLTIIGVLEND